MNRYDALDRELRAWFIDAPVPRTLGLRDDVLQQTAQLRQRPRWSFLERWLPVTVVQFRRRRTVPPVPWRAIGLLAVLALLLAALAVYAGSRQRLPPPFGLAGSGQVAYAQNGDIFTVDPATGIRQQITSGPESDEEPRWSLDGTRLAFLRGTETGKSLVVAAATSGDVISMIQTGGPVDADSLAWSPDGRMITMDSLGDLYLVDAATGASTRIAVPYAGLDVYWHPPDGRQLLFMGGSAPAAADAALYVVDVDDPRSLREIARPRAGAILRPSGWADEGRKVVYTLSDPNTERVRTHVHDLATGTDVIIDAGFAHTSNDGRRLVALSDIGRPCVVSVDGGPCHPIGTPNQAYVGYHAAGAFWSPDDAWIIVRRSPADESILLDPDGHHVDQPSWIDDGAISWQRVAR